MKTGLLLKIAAGLILFFAAGHAVGHITRKNIADPAGRSVVAAMESYTFNITGMTRTFDNYYEGMSINLIITLVALALLLWIVSAYAEDNRKFSIAVLAPVEVCVAGFCITGFLYFFLVPAITCLAAAVLIGAAMLQLKK